MGFGGCKKYLRNLLKPLQESFLEFRYVLGRFEVGLLVSFGENQKKGDTTFTKPLAKIEVDLLWFVSTVDQDKQALQVFPYTQVFANKFFPVFTKGSRCFSIPVTWKIHQIPVVVDQKMIDQLGFSRSLR